MTPEQIEAVRRGVQSAKVQLGSIHAISEALAALDRLTKERDEARKVIEDMRATAVYRRAMLAEARTRLSAMQEAIDEAYKAAMGDNPCAVVQLLRPFAAKPEPEVDPLVAAITEVWPGAAKRFGDAIVAETADHLRTALAARGGRVLFDGRDG